MDITPFLETLRTDLANAAQVAGPEAQAAAERMTLSLEPALRLALLDALTQAAAEISTELPSGSVEVRLRGRDPEFVVDVPAPTLATEALGPEEPTRVLEPEEDDETTLARITLRIPESLKSRAEELAGKSGQSLNAWIVSALRLATREKAVNIDVDLSSLPFGGDSRSGRSSRRMTGWQ
jgi:hypothetical protein